MDSSRLGIGRPCFANHLLTAIAACVSVGYSPSELSTTPLTLRLILTRQPLDFWCSHTFTKRDVLFSFLYLGSLQESGCNRVGSLQVYMKFYHLPGATQAGYATKLYNDLNSSNGHDRNMQ